MQPDLFYVFISFQRSSGSSGHYVSVLVDIYCGKYVRVETSTQVASSNSQTPNPTAATTGTRGKMLWPVAVSCADSFGPGGAPCRLPGGLALTLAWHWHRRWAWPMGTNGCLNFHNRPRPCAPMNGNTASNRGMQSHKRCRTRSKSDRPPGPVPVLSNL